MEKFELKYHFHPKKGWINDPNGFVKAFGKYFLFYQYNPNSIKHENILWGVATSYDLIHFEEQGIALHTDKDYDQNGCWSGSAIFEDNILYLYYTGNKDTKEAREQTQNLAVSYDGKTFTKVSNNPIINKDHLPQDCSSLDFRDPSIFKEEDTYYIIIGCKSTSDKANLLLFESKDMKSFSFVKYLEKDSPALYMFECPTSARLTVLKRNEITKSYEKTSQSKRILLASLIDFKKESNLNEQSGGTFDNHMATAYQVLQEDKSSKINSYKQLHRNAFKEIDKGFDFYAPIICNESYIQASPTDFPNKAKMIAWMAMWERNWFANENNLDWNHNLTLTRDIQILAKDELLDTNKMQLLQKPLIENSHYFKTVFTKKIKLQKGKQFNLPQLNGFYKHIKLKLEKYINYKIQLLSNKKNYALVEIKDNTLIFDIRNYAYKVKGNINERSTKQGYRSVNISLLEEWDFDIYLDRACIEIFSSDGTISLSNMYYAPHNADKFFIESDSKIQPVITIEAKDFNDKQLISLGESLLDIIDKKKFVAGAPLNFISAARLYYEFSHFASFQTFLSDSDISKRNYLRMQKEIKKEKVINLVSSEDIPLDLDLPQAVVTTAKDGERSFEFKFKDTSLEYMWMMPLNNIPTINNYFYFGTVPFIFEKNIEFYKEYFEFLKGKNEFIFDPNIRLSLFAEERIVELVLNFMTYAKHTKLSQEEYDLLAKHLECKLENTSLESYLFGNYPKLESIMLTKGSKGSTLYRRHKKAISVKAVKVDPTTIVDTTGAGDSYYGVFIGYLLNKCKTLDINFIPDKLIKEAMTKASEISCKVCQKKGCLPLRSYLAKSK